jgi:hypothetical protein
LRGLSGGDDAENLTIFEKAQDERRYRKMHDCDRGYTREGEQGKFHNVTTPGEKVFVVR